VNGRDQRATLLALDLATGAVLTALHRRAETGHGAFVEVSLHECGIAFLGEHFVEYQVTGREPERQAKGVYPAAGDDEWIAIDGPVDFDSGELGYGPKGYTAASNRGDWQTPKNLPAGTYTYFCRVHPFMRGSFRVVGGAPSGGSATSPSRARPRPRVVLVRVRRGVARVRVGCGHVGEACRGRLVARWRARTVATARFAVPPGRARAVALRLTRAGRAALRARGRLAVRLTVRGRGAARSRVTLVAAR